MKFIHILVIAGLILLQTGCGYSGYKEGISTNAQESYFYFSGNTDAISVSIDGGERFTVDAGVSHQYKTKPGKHSIQVFRLGEMIVNRNVYLSNGVSKEIEVQ